MTAHHPDAQPPVGGAIQRVGPGTILIQGLPPGQPVRFYLLPFFSWCTVSANLTPHTIAAYRNALGPFAAFCDEHLRVTSPEQVKPWMIQAYLASRRVTHDNGPATVSQHRSALSTFFRFLRLYDIMTADPVEPVKGPKVPQQEPRYYDVPTQERLLTRLRERAVLGPREWRDFALISLLVLAGLRNAEAGQLELGDLKLDSGSLLVRQGKGRKDRHVIVIPWLQDVLRRYLDEIRPRFRGATASPYVFVGRRGQALDPRSLWELVQRVTGDVLRAPGINPHGLRHSYTARLVEGEANLVAVQRQLGHANLATTGRYAHLPTSRMTARMAKWMAGKYTDLEVPEAPAAPERNPIDRERRAALRAHRRARPRKP